MDVDSFSVLSYAVLLTLLVFVMDSDWVNATGAERGHAMTGSPERRRPSTRLGACTGR
jgi:hypothetical protein